MVMTMSIMQLLARSSTYKYLSCLYDFRELSMSAVTIHDNAVSTDLEPFD
jgi:hypothetical protein